MRNKYYLFLKFSFRNLKFGCVFRNLFSKHFQKFAFHKIKKHWKNLNFCKSRIILHNFYKNKSSSFPQKLLNNYLLTKLFLKKFQKNYIRTLPQTSSSLLFVKLSSLLLFNSAQPFLLLLLLGMIKVKSNKMLTPLSPLGRFMLVILQVTPQ